MLTRMQIDEETLAERQEKIKTIFYPTKLNFLRSHLGFRPGKLHLFIAPPSGGKSTMRNTIIFDFLQNNLGKKIFLWLSEESKDDFIDDLAKNSSYKLHFDRLSVFSEEDDPNLVSAQSDAGSFFNEVILEADPDLIIFDNITTSRVYGQQFQQQEKLINELKVVPHCINIPMVVFAHTDSSIKSTSDIITGTNSIRGSKSLSNRTEFSYIMQNFVKGGIRETIVKIDKHRQVDIEAEWFLLKYGKGQGRYTNDLAVPFEIVKKLYKEQDKLK